MTRRLFLKTTAMLLATTAASASVFNVFKNEEEKIDYVKSLSESLDSGYVRNKIFYFNHPISLDVDDVTFDRCEFVFSGFGGDYAMEINGSRIEIFNSMIDASMARCKYVVSMGAVTKQDVFGSCYFVGSNQPDSAGIQFN